MTGQYLKRRMKASSKKIGGFVKKIPYSIRRAYTQKRIKSRDFTVISNNCWAGKLYQYLDMPYLSPTVGLYFFADDYIRFVQNLKYYISLELRFISYLDSKYSDTLFELNQTAKVIGVLGDVEIVFLHYHSQEEAYEKWNRRKARINWEHLYIKFSKMNLCNEQHLKAFDCLDYKHKFMLTTRKKKKYQSEVYWNGKTDQNDQIVLDTFPFPGKINLVKIFK